MAHPVVQAVQTSQPAQAAMDVAANTSELINDRMVGNLISALVFSAVGLLAFGVAYAVFDVITPKVSVWKEICEKQNLAVAVFLAAMVLGISMIISAAIHG
jgi:uncharacterized membrane protein YjfL (UPF0719 family)